MKQTLVTSEAKRFEYLMQGDEVVTRIYERILAFFDIHFGNHPVGVRQVLAVPEFSGSKAEEKIQWTTELFESTPVKLSSLKGEERKHYQEILKETLDDVRDMVAILPKGVSSMLQKAVTYHSDDMVFCAEDKVVIAEWGMYPKGRPNYHTLALELAKPPRFGPWSKGNRVVTEETPIEKETPMETEQVSEQNDLSQASTGDDIGYTPPIEDPVVDDPQPQEEIPSAVEQPPVKDNDEGGQQKKKRWWLWLLLLIPLLLLLSLFRKCGKENLVTPPPPVGEDDIEWKDTLTPRVNNRLILLFSEDKPVEEFVRDFRKRYPDKEKYQLYVPDDMLPRIVLTLPKEEIDDMSARLPDELSEYNLMVIPEAVFEGGRTFTDPVFNDQVKSWYFNMINVQAAWDYTIGSPDIIVAIIDDGFDLNHPELKGKDIVKPYNAATHSSNVFPDRNSGHGTHVASTAVGLADNGEGSSGIAPGCKLMPIQVANENGIMTTSAVVDAVLYAIKNGADVVNMSLGQEFNPMLAMFPRNTQERIIETQFKTEEDMWEKIFSMGMKGKKDMAFVMAGGNQNILIGIDPMQRIEGTIKVSAVEPSRMKADFSNYGDYSVLSAPGVQIYQAVSGEEKYATYDGTSMASPIVAGGFALMKSAYPNKSVKDITKQLQKTGLISPSKVGRIIHFGNAMGYEEPETPPPGGGGNNGNNDPGNTPPPGGGNNDNNDPGNTPPPGGGNNGNNDPGNTPPPGGGNNGNNDPGITPPPGGGGNNDNNGPGITPPPGGGGNNGNNGPGNTPPPGGGNNGNNGPGITPPPGGGNNGNNGPGITPPPSGGGNNGPGKKPAPILNPPSQPQPQPIPGDNDCPDCNEAQRRYQELLRQLEELIRNNPGCVYD